MFGLTVRTPDVWQLSLFWSHTLEACDLDVHKKVQLGTLEPRPLDQMLPTLALNALG